MQLGEGSETSSYLGQAIIKQEAVTTLGKVAVESTTISIVQNQLVLFCIYSPHLKHSSTTLETDAVALLTAMSMPHTLWYRPTQLLKPVFLLVIRS